MSEFTNGKMTYRTAEKPDNTGGYDYCIIDENNKIIAETFAHVGFTPEGDYEKRDALGNAQRFCTMNDLYEALEALCKSENHLITSDMIANGLKALAKARGES